MESYRTYQPSFNVEELRTAIRAEYKEVACNKDHTIHFTSGKVLAKRLGYVEGIMKMMPQEAIRPFAGVGNPFSMGVPQKSETILDIGSGAGFDCIYGSFITSGQSNFLGLDMTDEMLGKAILNVNEAGLSNITFLKGFAEEIPLPTCSVDLVISNGVINLCPNKHSVYKEIYRILKPNGRFQIADVILNSAVPSESKDLIHLWTNCIAGAITHEEYFQILRDVGFYKNEIKRSYDVFNDARIAKSAFYFGAKGYNIRGIKP